MATYQRFSATQPPPLGQMETLHVAKTTACHLTLRWPVRQKLLPEKGLVWFGQGSLLWTATESISHHLETMVETIVGSHKKGFLGSAKWLVCIHSTVPLQNINPKAQLTGNKMVRFKTQVYIYICKNTCNYIYIYIYVCIYVYTYGLLLGDRRAWHWNGSGFRGKGGCCAGSGRQPFWGEKRKVMDHSKGANLTVQLSQLTACVISQL